MTTATLSKSARLALLDALDQKRGFGSARALARALGLPHTTLAAIYAHSRPVSVPFLRAVRQCYPDLSPYIDAFLLEDEQESAA
jgi:hypothetical protein